MKKYLLVCLFSILIISGCATEKKEASTIETSSSENKNSEVVLQSSSSSEKDSAESFDIVSKGVYFVGQDIKPGTYYIVLSEMNYSEQDTNKDAYTTISIIENENDSVLYEMFESVGAKIRMSLKDGQRIIIDDNYSPVSYTISLMNDKDFKNYYKK